MQVTHLSVRSGYSFYRSMIQIEDYIAYAKQLAYDTLTLTDENVLHGAIPFYQKCKKENIKPIIGMIVQVEEQETAFTLLAKSRQGYQNLMQVSTIIQQKDTITMDELANYHEDLICILHTEKEAIRQAMTNGDISVLVDQFDGLYGKENVYLQVSAYEETDPFIQVCKQLAETHDYSFVAMQDIRYLRTKDAPTFATLKQMATGEVMNKNTKLPSSGSHYFYTKEEMRTLFRDFPASIAAIEEISSACDLRFRFDELLLPAFPLPNGMDAATYIKQQCAEKVYDRYKVVTDEVKARMKRELDIIISLGFADYFLIVADYVQFAKDAGIAVGPGRGSAAGSIVSYILGITNVDPLAYQLLFERFLNPERVTMPDIDMDFSDRRREEVIAYVREKYGDDYVAQIITFDRFGARSIIRELMKTLDINQHDRAYVLQELGHYSTGSIVQFMKERESFASYVKQSSELRALFTHAVKLEGLARHHSIHAAGIVLGKDPLVEHVPLMQSSHEMNMTQYPMNDLEAIGLLKMDILGLRNLSIIEQIVQSIKRTTGKSLLMDEIEEEDEKTYALLRAGKTNGIFQFESDGMKRVLTKLKPTNFHDLVAINALYRPGPMQHIDAFIARKHGERFTYIDDAVAPILKETYGVLVYQEQIMQIAHTVANYSLGQADVLRRAVSKKQRQLMIEQERMFMDGARENGYQPAIAKEIFSWIVQFADYGFPKSHAVAYSKIAYQLSYLKANYPEHFFPPLLTSAIQDSKKLAAYVKEAKQLGLEILAPSINKSFGMFTIEKGNIRIGLQLIKGVGYDTVKNIVEARKNESFVDLYDFCSRTNIRRNVLENLIMAGAFDELHANRASLLASIDEVMNQIGLFTEGSLFNERMKTRVKYVDTEDFTIVEKLRDEKELLHMYVSSHPLETYRSILQRRGFITTQKVSHTRLNEQVKIAGIIQESRKIQTKRGESMAFMTLQDEVDTMDTVIFPKVYRQVHSLLEAEQVVQIVGKVSERNGERQIIVDRLEPLPVEELGEADKTLYIQMKERTPAETREFFQKLAKQAPGNIPIVIHNPKTKETFRMQSHFSLAINEPLFRECVRFFGVQNVVIK